MGTFRPLIGRETWGRGPSAHPAGGRSLEGLLANKSYLIREEFSAGASRPSNGREVVPRGIPPVGRAGGSPGYISPHLPQNCHFIQKKKEREERKREEEAAKPCSHVDLEVYSHSSRIIT
jgi:hypothetical protein